MKKIVACLLVALTVLSLTLYLVPTALSQPEDVKIVSKSWYFDSIGGLAVVGEAQNIGSSPINRIFLSGTVTLLDGTTKSTTGTVWVKYLAPGQKAPFDLSFMVNDIMSQSPNTYGPADVVNIDVSVSVADTTSSYQYQGLTITAQSSSIDNTDLNRGTFWVSGTLKNTGTQTATSVRILGTFYNSEGIVVAVGGYTSDPLTQSLAPSATVDFKLPAYDVNQTGVSSAQKITTYTLLVQAESPLSTDTPPKATPYPANTYPSNSATPTPGGATSPADTAPPTDSQTPGAQTPGSDNTSNATDSSPPIWIYAVVAIVAVAIVVAVLAVRKRKTAIAPAPKKLLNNKAKHKA